MLRSFNGATAFQPWRSDPRTGRRIAKTLLQWGHSFSAGEITDHVMMLPGEYCFNGATAFQPWRSIYLSYCERSNMELQWGHSFSAVEISIVNEFRNLVSLLQWGHSFSAVEICSCRAGTE